MKTHFYFKKNKKKNLKSDTIKEFLILYYKFVLILADF